MSLATTLLGFDRPDRPETLYGVILHLVPNRTRPDLQFEVQRASDASGTGATSISSTVGPFPLSGGRFIDLLPNDGVARFYRARHVGPSVDPGAYSSPWIGVVPYRIRATRWRPSIAQGADDGVAVSSSWQNPQASILPFSTTSPGTLFSYATGGIGNLQMWTSFSWNTSQNFYQPDGSTIALPGPEAALSAPTLSQVAGGTRGALTLFGRIAYARIDGLTTLWRVSAEASFAVSANNLLKITSPADPGDGKYSGWFPLVGDTTNLEYVQGISPLAFGTDYTEPVGHFSTTGNSRYSTSWKSPGVTIIGLDASTTYYYYPFYDQNLGYTRFYGNPTVKSNVAAQQQNGDGHLSLGPYDAANGYSGVISISTPGGGGSGSGSAGGGRLT
jgi:hypothetical protein